MIVIGISGATCSGKTSLAKGLVNVLKGLGIQAYALNQDEYYFPDESPFHEKIPSLHHINWELSSAFDNDAIVSEIKRLKSNADWHGSFSNAEKVKVNSIVSKIAESAKDYQRFIDDLTQESKTISGDFQRTRSVLVVEGILIFNHHKVYELCDQRYFLTLSESECWKRRQLRAYDPPDVPGYFQQVVWPHYLSNLNQIKDKKQISFISGKNHMIENFVSIFQPVLNAL